MDLFLWSLAVAYIMTSLSSSHLGMLRELITRYQVDAEILRMCKHMIFYSTICTMNGVGTGNVILPSLIRADSPSSRTGVLV